MKKVLWMCMVVSAIAVHAANLIPGDSSFETGHGAWDENTPIKKGDAVDGTHALEIFGKAARTNAVFDLQHGTPYVFSVYLKSADGKNATIHLQAYRTNWDGKYINKFVKVDGSWKRYTLEIPPQMLGGYNKFWLHIYPDKNVRVLADAVQMEQGDKPTDFASVEKVGVACEIPCKVAGRVFYPGEGIELILNYFNAQNTPENAERYVRITDYNGKVIYDSTVKKSFKAKENASEVIKLGKADRKGFYMVRYGLKGSVKLDKNATFAVVDQPVTLNKGYSSIFGICGGPNHYIPSLERIGVRAQAAAARWSYSRGPGKFDENSMKHVDECVNLSLKTASSR